LSKSIGVLDSAAVEVDSGGRILPWLGGGCLEQWWGEIGEDGIFGLNDDRNFLDDGIFGCTLLCGFGWIICCIQH
jgi:hypothetical protein